MPQNNEVRPHVTFGLGNKFHCSQGNPPGWDQVIGLGTKLMEVHMKSCSAKGNFKVLRFILVCGLLHVD